MNFQKRSVKGIGLLIVAMVLAVPMVAQQEIAPDHFDTPAANAQNHKPAAGKPSNAHSKQTAVRHVSKPKSAQAATVVKGEPVTVAVDTKSR